MDDRLTRTLAEIGEAAPHDPQLARTVRRRAEHRRRPALVLLPVAAAAAVVAVVVAVVLAALALTGSPPTATPGPAAGPTSCRAATTGVLPAWARGGFRAPYEARYATSTSGDLLAVLFVDLRQPQVAGTANKVLWVSREPVASPARLTGELLGSDRTTRVDLPSGLGPSYVDVPVSGCWRFRVTWAGGSDQIDLAYAG